MFNGRLKITVISATELQETNFMKRLQLTESAPPVQLDPYVAIDVDEVIPRPIPFANTLQYTSINFFDGT